MPFLSKIKEEAEIHFKEQVNSDLDYLAGIASLNMTKVLSDYLATPIDDLISVDADNFGLDHAKLFGIKVGIAVNEAHQTIKDHIIFSRTEVHAKSIANDIVYLNVKEVEKQLEALKPSNTHSIIPQ